MKIRYFLLAVILGFSFTACKDINGSGKKKDNKPIVISDEAKLESLIVGGNVIELGTPSLSIETATAKTITLLDSIASAGAVIEATAVSEDAVIRWGKMNPGETEPAWTQLQTLSFSSGEFLVVQVTVENVKPQYYKFVIAIEDDPQETAGLLGKVLILQAYGTGNKTDGGVSHSFIELYNKSNEDADLSGYLLQYSAGGTAWKSLNLSGKIIPAGRSFLVLGKFMNALNNVAGTGTLQLNESDADMRWQDGSGYLQMDNNSYKVFLVKSNETVTIINPFDAKGDKTGKKAEGYVDLLGTNDSDQTKSIDAFETNALANPSVKAPFYSSKGKSLRRVNLEDTDDNARDFERVEWRPGFGESIPEEEFNAFKPRSLKDGPWNPVFIRDPIGKGSARIGSLVIGGADADTGTPAAVYSAVNSPGKASITSLVAGSATVNLSIADGATFRTAKAAGNESPKWENSALPVYSFIDGDFLYIEVTSANKLNVNVYKIVITVTGVSGTVSVSGDYSLILNPAASSQQRVAIEVFKTETANNTGLISRADAIITTNGPNGTGTWSLYIPSGLQVWFKIAVTDSTGITFGKVVTNGQSFNSSTTGMNLTLGPFLAPVLSDFTLINADASAGTKRNKKGSIDEGTGNITFADTSFTTISTNTIIDFHKLTAEFIIPEGCKLFAGTKEQISGVTANNYYKEVIFTVVSEDNIRKNYRVAAPAAGSYRVLGTQSWQTQGFGVLNVNTADKTLGMPINASGLNQGTKLNIVWNPTGSFTYIGPEGNVIEGGTSIKGHGNYSVRYHPENQRSYSLKLDEAAGFEYFDYTLQGFRTLPANKRWVLLSNYGDSSRIMNAMGFEMGRRVLDKMGWQPHADHVFFFLNGTYKGVYILAEERKIDAERMNILPEASISTPKGGFIVEMNNTCWYGNDIQNQSSQLVFDDLYNFMTSHQNPVRNTSGNDAGSGQMKMQGIVWSFKAPDENLGWYYSDPQEGNGTLTYSDTEHFPRKAIVLHAKLAEGTEYNRPSKPANEWIVANGHGQANGMGFGNMLQAGTLPNGSNGGIAGSTTLGSVYPNWQSSAFVTMAQFIQDAEDKIYAHDYGVNGKGGCYDYIDIESFIDWQIAFEMNANWEIIALNGQFMYFDPSVQKLKMGIIWDLKQAWNTTTTNGAEPGFVRKVPLWYKELLGWEITGTAPANAISGKERPGAKDPYYVQELKKRWAEVKTQFRTKLDPYMDAQKVRFARIKGYSHPIGVNDNQDRYKNIITTMIDRIDPIFEGY